MNDEFNLPESTVMHRLGLRDRDDMRSMRQELLTENADWANVGSRIMLTAGAAEKLAAHLRVLPASLAVIKTAAASSHHLDTPMQKNAALPLSPEAPAPKKPVPMLVVRRPINPRILLCSSPDLPGALLTVRVKSNANFLPGSPTGQILASLTASGVYEFAGNPNSENHGGPRCPRWPGRW